MSCGTDPILDWPLLCEGTTQAEAIVNELIARQQGALVRVKSYGDTAPPGAPVNFDAYILGAAPTGVWTGKGGNIAVYMDGWKFMPAIEGMRCWVMDDNFELIYSGSAWVNREGYQTLIAATNVDWDTRIGRVANILLNQNITLNAPTGMVDGRTYILIVKQDPTGGRTITWNGTFKWPAGAAPALSGLNKVDVFTFFYSAAMGGFLGHTHGLDIR